MCCHLSCSTPWFSQWRDSFLSILYTYIPCPPCCLVVRMMLVETSQSTVYWLGNGIQDLLLVFRVHIIQGIHYLSCRTENWCQFRVWRAAAGNAKKWFLSENQGKWNCMVNFGDLGLEWGKIQLNKFQKSVHETGTYPSISSIINPINPLIIFV